MDRDKTVFRNDGIFNPDLTSFMSKGLGNRLQVNSSDDNPLSKILGRGNRQENQARIGTSDFTRNFFSDIFDKSSSNSSTNKHFQQSSESPLNNQVAIRSNSGRESTNLAKRNPRDRDAEEQESGNDRQVGLFSGNNRITDRYLQCVDRFLGCVKLNKFVKLERQSLSVRESQNNMNHQQVMAAIEQRKVASQQSFDQVKYRCDTQLQITKNEIQARSELAEKYFKQELHKINQEHERGKEELALKRHAIDMDYKTHQEKLQEEAKKRKSAEEMCIAGHQKEIMVIKLQQETRRQAVADLKNLIAEAGAQLAPISAETFIHGPTSK